MNVYVSNRMEYVFRFELGVKLDSSSFRKTNFFIIYKLLSKGAWIVHKGFLYL